MKLLIDTDTMTVTVADAAAAQASSVYPRVEIVDGAQFNLLAPINPAWRPSMYGRIFYRVGTGLIGHDPSNGNEGSPPQPLRSPGGWPLRYTFDQAGGIIGTATVCNGDAAFNNDQEVEQALAAAAASDAAQAARDAEQGAQWISGGTRKPAAPPTDQTAETV